MPWVNHFIKADLSSYHFTMDVKARFLLSNISDAFTLVLEPVKNTKWHDYKRLKELLGHTPKEVFAGAVLGIIIGAIRHL